MNANKFQDLPIIFKNFLEFARISKIVIVKFILIIIAEKCCINKYFNMSLYINKIGQ
jgi:hypothetical protein